MTKLYRMTHVRPLGRAIPVDVELLAVLDKDCRKEAQMFADWQRRADDYPLPEDWWISERQAMLREMQTPKWVAPLIGILCACLAAVLVWGAYLIGRF